MKAGLSEELLCSVHLFEVSLERYYSSYPLYKKMKELVDTFSGSSISNILNKVSRSTSLSLLVLKTTNKKLQGRTLSKLGQSTEMSQS